MKLQEVELVKKNYDSTVTETVDIPQKGVIDPNTLLCPYCGESSHMEIGRDFFMCNTCKGRFLNSGNDNVSFDKVSLVKTTNDIETAILLNNNKLESQKLEKHLIK